MATTRYFRTPNITVYDAVGAVQEVNMPPVPTGAQRLIIAASGYHNDAVNHNLSFRIITSSGLYAMLTEAVSKAGNVHHTLPRPFLIPEGVTFGLWSADACNPGSLMRIVVWYYELLPEDPDPWLPTS